ncbi:hypothetical protein [Mariniflexile sp.]|uniref:hypothetical protein n=1 Tax=Mariniflexile sp. TaxID=1979402 RepID=UPI0035622EB9
MVLNSTYKNKKQEELINDLVGKPFGLLRALKMGGIGSKRLIIDTVSAKMEHYINTVSDITYANIELRPIGILIRINKGLKNFTWVIPYYQLVIYKTNGCSIHAQGQFVHFKNNINFKENKAFFTKMLDEKVKYDSQHNFYPS